MDETPNSSELFDEHSPQINAEPIIVNATVPSSLHEVADAARRKRQELIAEHRVRLGRMWRIAFILFVATCFSTWLSAGATYAVALMSILLAHEFGHFLQAVRHRVPASPPFFIPFPLSPIGTMGAVIMQAGGAADRKQMFDIAISGPLAGLLLALPIAWWGVTQSTLVEIPPNSSALIFGDPLVLQWMIERVHGAKPPGFEVALNPLLFAGWVGIFITALNLMPIGQLDGGHILYCLIGRRAHTVALLLVASAVGYMAYTRDFGYAVMLFLLVTMGTRHPPTANDRAPLGPIRIVLGWLTLAFVLIGFTPRPIFELPGETEMPIPARPDLDQRAV